MIPLENFWCSYNPAENRQCPTITVTVEENPNPHDCYDGETSCENSQSFLLTITPANDPPVLDSIGDRVIDEDTFTIISLSASPGGTGEEDDLIFTALSADPDNVPAEVDGTSLTLTPNPDWNGV